MIEALQELKCSVLTDAFARVRMRLNVVDGVRTHANACEDVIVRTLLKTSGKIGTRGGVAASSSAVVIFQCCKRSQLFDVNNNF